LEASAREYASRTVSVDSPEQLEGLRRVGRLVAATLRGLRAAVAPGVSTGELDRLAGELFAKRGAQSGPILTYGYPGSICISVDDEVVHGIPGRRILRSGELVTLDVAAELDGYHADAAITVPVGATDPRALQLVSATRAALSAGIRAATAGRSLRDVGAAVERTAEQRGFRVIRQLTGHGIGRAMHEAPTVFNWPAPGATQRLKPGQVFTIEPMLAAGDPKIVLDRDGWTVRTSSGCLSAHEEHTIVVTKRAAVVLTSHG
jgi:methionyl aminopeptidase